MKAARYLLLVLLTLVLPLRGALANIACCSGDLAGWDGVMAQAHDRMDHAVAHDMGGGHHDHHDHPGNPEQPSAHAHDGHDAGPDGQSAASDKCHACTASCSAASVLGSMPVLPMPAASADVVFPALLAPPPNHASEGQERPPRSC